MQLNLKLWKYENQMVICGSIRIFNVILKTVTIFVAFDD